MNEIEVDIDFINEVGQKIREILSSDPDKSKWYKNVINIYYKKSEYPPNIIKEIADYLTSTKVKENLSLVDSIKAIIQDEDNIENFLGSIFFPSLFESDAIMRPDITNQLSIYIKNGGNPELIARILMEHYRGIPNMISIISKILVDVAHVDPQEIIKEQVRNDTLRIFKKYKMDNLLLTQEKVPKEFKFMFQDPFWIDTIINLSEQSENSQSLFIAYCMNKICKSHPEKIKSLPPFYISYKSFHNVLQYTFSRMKTNPDPKILDTLVNIISTDDLTLVHAALIFHDLPPETLIKITGKLKDSKKRDLFNKINLNMGSETDMNLSRVIPGIASHAKLTISELKKILELEDVSPHMKTLIIKKISDVLKDRNNSDQLIDIAIDCMLKITEQSIDDDDRDFIRIAFKKINGSYYDLNDYLNIILYIIKFPFFSDIIKEIAINQLTPTLEQPDKSVKSPQSQIICEFAYKNKDKIPSIITSLIKVLKNNFSQSNSNEFLSDQLFDIFIYLIQLGYSKEVLKKYSEMMKVDTISKKSPHLHRAFILDLIKLDFPNDFRSPAVCRYIESITYLFDNPNILSKIVPESSVNVQSTFKKHLPDLKKFLAKIPDSINISDEAMEIINSVRFKLQSLNL